MKLLRIIIIIIIIINNNVDTLTLPNTSQMYSQHKVRNVTCVKKVRCVTKTHSDILSVH